MSYSSKINDNIIPVNYTTAAYIFSELPNSSKVSTGGLNNIGVTLNGTKYILKNTSLGDFNYNLYDIVDAAVAAGYTSDQIYNAIQTGFTNTENYYKNESPYKQWNATSEPTQGVARKSEYEAVQSIKNAQTVFNTVVKSSQDISTINVQTNSIAQKLQNTLVEKYPHLKNARVVVNLKTDGNGYTYRIAYEDPYNAGNTLYTTEITDLSEANLDSITAASDPSIGSVLNSVNNASANATADWNMAQTVLDALDRGGLKNANAYNNLSEADRAAITAALPSTEKLDAWNQTKDSTVFQTLIQNLQKDNPELLTRIDYDTLKSISDTVTSEQQSVTERNISNQQAQLLQNIAKDPNLYGSLVQQQRADNAAGTIAGQRAANAQAVASEADANYDAQAAELYKSLFSGEKGNVAQNVYSENYGNSVNTLDTIIQGKLDDAVAKENLNASQITELDSMLQALADATGIDVARWADAISEAQAEAGGKASSLISAIQGNLEKAQSDNKANIEKVQTLFGEGSSYVNQGSANGTDVSDAVKIISEELAKSVASSGYGTVSPGDYEKAKQLANQQYSDLITSEEGQEFVKWILDNDTINALTKQQTLEDFMKSNDLDVLTLDGLTSYYNDYNKEATGQANKVFNQAQRAYIAAITAGDVKTADQLARLATSASTSKGNLFAASALANQFKQQSGLSNNGRQLATDFLNQQSFNRGNEAKAQYDAATAQLKYLGSGNQQSNGATLYEAYNKAMQNKANATNAYSKFGSNIMGSNQDMSSWAVKNNIDNWNRRVDVANSYTAANAAGAASNNEVQGAIETLRAQALAKQKQAEQLNPSLKKP